MKTLQHLRQLKSAALDRMEALNALVKRDKRDLTETEKLDYTLKRDLAENLNVTIALAEAELQESAPAPVAAAPSEVDFFPRNDRDRDAPFLRRG